MRQVSFTLLMACRCDSNTAQYERNRSFGHLVHALGRAAGGAKLPSAGLCLNASKAEASLAESGKDMLTVEPRESGGSKQCDFTSRASPREVRRRSPFGSRRSMLSV